MASFLHLGEGMGNLIPSPQLLSAIVSIAFCYLAGCAVYNLYFHPLARFPGPKLAALSNLWWARARTSGRYPWAIESALHDYGHVVRIAPNEVAFLTPQAAADIYLAHERNLEQFVQVGYDALDTGDGGISGETSPLRHREIAKKLSPAFSSRNLKAKEETILKHIDGFLSKMEQIGGQGRGAELQSWTDWLALDLSSDMTYGSDPGQVRNMKDSTLLSSSLKLNRFLAMSQVGQRLRLLTPLAYLSFPPSVLFLLPELISMNTRDVQKRIQLRENLPHLDYFEQILPSNEPVPTDKKHLFHLENVGGQILLASWQPLANQFYSLIFFLLKTPQAYRTLVWEVREAFSHGGEIDMAAAASLKYLRACVQESLRLHQDTVDGLPRISPGASVDGEFIPQGTICQISYFAAARSSKYFTEPLSFLPERWLRPGDANYDERYSNDNLKASKPFSQGPRGCPGGHIATTVIQVFLAKVIWNFDLELAPDQDLAFDKDFKFFMFWERPPFWVRFKPIVDTKNVAVGDAVLN